MLLSVREKERRQHTIKAHHHRQQLPAFVNCIYTCMLNEKQTKNELQFQLKQLRLFHVLFVALLAPLVSTQQQRLMLTTS